MTEDLFRVLEMCGHEEPDSKIERLWQSYKGPYSFVQQRTRRYSARSGMSYAPVAYSLKRFEMDYAHVDREWVRKNFQMFVRDEFGSQIKAERGLSEVWPNAKEIVVGWDELDRILSNSEWYKTTRIELPKDYEVDSLASAIYGILCNNAFGSRKNLSNNREEYFVEAVTPVIEKQARLQILVPGFPFKDQNILRVKEGAGDPDLSELCMLFRLFNLVEALYQVYPYGTDVIVLMDGMLYADVFNVAREDVLEYAKRLKDYRNRMNIQGTVSFLDIDEMFKIAMGENAFTEAVEDLKMQIISLRSVDEEFASYFLSLVAGMKRNVCSKEILAGLTPAECESVLNGIAPNESLSDICSEITKRAESAAILYASINLLIRKVDLFRSFFPEAIRGTVHPKKGQFSLTGGSPRYAWNGVAFSERWPQSTREIRIVDYTALTDHENLQAVRFGGSEGPLCYIGGTRTPNLDAAKQIYSEPMRVGSGLIVRKLMEEDEDAFIRMGENDPEYSWGMIQQSNSYYRTLFRYRLNHYERFGFGICGVWFEDEFAGQFGIQTLNEDDDSIELVIFLGKSYRGKGIGTSLMSSIFKELDRAGIKELFALVRPENVGCKALIEKFQGKQSSSVMHFNEISIVYRMEVKQACQCAM